MGQSKMAIDSGYYHRSMKFFNQDYGRALSMLNKWINAGEPQGILDRPLFTEVREGHLQAMKQLGILNRYRSTFFLKTPEKRKQRHRERYYNEKNIVAKNAMPREKMNFRPDDLKLFMLMVDSLKGEVCFGCRREFQAGESFGKVSKFGKKNEFWVHRDEKCAKLASENFKAGLK